jgi:hypothetical protein
MQVTWRLAAFVVFAYVCSTCAEKVAAATVSLNPVADAFVSSANPTNNYGGAGGLEVSATALPKGEFQAIMQFDLASAKSSFDATFGPGQWTTQSISLQLSAGSPNNAILNTSAAGQWAVNWMLNDVWTEGSGTPNAPGAAGITFNTLPSFLSGGDQTLGVFSFDGATSGTASYSLALATGLVGDASAGGLASLRLSAADQAMSGFFNSRTFNNAATRPLLTITATAVPEPSAWLLGVLGCIGMAAVWCRRPV